MMMAGAAAAGTQSDVGLFLIRHYLHGGVLITRTWM